MGDVVLSVKPGAVRRVRTTSRLKRLSFGELLRALGATAWQFLGREGLKLPVEFTPSVLLRAWPPSEEDRDTPPSVGLPPGAAVHPMGGDPTSCALADRIRDASFALQSRGYSARDVDRHLAAVATALEAGRTVDPSELTGSGYSRARRGYEVEGVDRFLDEIRDSLAEGT